jgi:hypothetical protein
MAAAAIRCQVLRAERAGIPGRIDESVTGTAGISSVEIEGRTAPWW